jgi:hypothetical protein
MCFITLFNTINEVNQINCKYKYDFTYRDLINETQKHKNLIYFFDRPTTSYLGMNGYSPYKSFIQDTYSNICYLGGWSGLTPVNQYAIEKYGYKNPYEALANLDNARFVDDRHSDMIFNYIKENYNQNIKKVFVKKIGTVKIYKIKKLKKEDK